MNDYDDDGLAVPDIQKIGTRFEIIWQDGVKIDIDKILPKRDMHVEAEILVTDYQEIGGSHILGPQRFTLTRSPKGILSDLRDNSSREDWKQRLSQLSFMILNRVREGEPIIDLNDRSTPEEPPEMVTGVCYQGTPTVLYGEGGIGKSMMGLALAMSVHNNVGISDSFQTIQGNAMILDYETSWEETYRRSRDIVRGSEHDMKMIYYRYCSQPLYQDVDALRNEIYDKNIRFLLIDSAGPACGGEPENASATLQYFQALRGLTDSETPLTTLTLAHVTKNSLTGSNRNPFGSVYWVNMPRNTFELKKAQVANANYIEVAMHHRKTNVGALKDPKAFRMTWADMALNIENLDIKRSALSQDLSMPKRAEILFQNNEIFQESGLSTKQIADELDIENERSLQATLSRSNKFYSKNGTGDISVWFPSF